jgi:hypothetical protein
LMEYWSKIKSKYRDIRLNEIGIFWSIGNNFIKQKNI